MVATFTPLCNHADLRQIIKFWLDRSLDGIHSKNGVLVGVENCDRPGWGLRSMPLLERYLSEDVEVVLAEMGRGAEPAPTYAALLLLESRYPVEDLSRAMSHQSCSVTQSFLCSAYDAFARLLLGR